MKAKTKIQKINNDWIFFDEETKKFEYLGKYFDSLNLVYSYFEANRFDIVEKTKKEIDYD